MSKDKIPFTNKKDFLIYIEGVKTIDRKIFEESWWSECTRHLDPRIMSNCVLNVYADGEAKEIHLDNEVLGRMKYFTETKDGECFHKAAYTIGKELKPCYEKVVFSYKLLYDP
jgi:hypothetical protein